ncbi:GIT2 protein, partial [Alectura lathami]|nr:GIT2 protein [Alectura lathami]
DPGWASINRGVLICDECCSVHRSLGRHISIVKHLRHSPWPATLLQMVHTLASNGANSIWEHSLLDPAQVQSGRRKANPQDKVHPTKSEFIRAKYQMLAFVHKLPCRDDDGVTAKDLSKQLHSSVRTGNLETCLRLLSLGAQANFFHPVSTRRASPGRGSRSAPPALGAAGLTLPPPLCVCPPPPNHAPRSLDLSELAKAAKKKLQAVSGEQGWVVWQRGRRSPLLPPHAAPQAPPSSFLGPGLGAVSFGKGLLLCAGVPGARDALDYSLRSQSDLDDQHDYDSVASDEDTDQELLRNASRNNRARSMDSSDLSDGPITLQEYLEVKKALAASEAKVQQLMKVNNSLSDELRRLQREIHKLQSENTQIRQQTGPPHPTPAPSERPEHGHPPAVAPSHRRDRQAFSMYEPGSALKPFGQPVEELVTRLQPFGSSVRRGAPALCGDEAGQGLTLLLCPQSKLDRHGSGTDSDYDNTQAGEILLGTDLPRSGPRSMEGKRFVELGKDEDFPHELDPLDGELDPGLPSTEDVILKTEQVTKNIQELLRAAQESKHDSFVPCSEKIHSAVTEMASLFPKKPALETVRSSLRLLNASAYRLQSECRKTVPPEPGAAVDYQLLTQQVIQCAYDIAKAAKQLVTITTRE